MTRNELIKLFFAEFIDPRSPDGTTWKFTYTDQGKIDSNKPAPSTNNSLPYTLPFNVS